MPEFQYLISTVYMLSHGKGIVLPPNCVRNRRQLLYRFELVPITHSRRQNTLAVSGHSPGFDVTTDGWSFAPSHWVARAQEDGFEQFMGIVPYAPLISVCRGKLLCMAAGPYALVICLALETNVVGMPTSLYREIISADYPGSNAEYGEELRVFRIPDRMADPNSSSSNEPRTIRIVAAFVSEEWTWVVNDFTSLVRMHLFALPTGEWTEDMITPGTAWWHDLFRAFHGGPDWNLEPQDALQNLNIWRRDVLARAPRPEQGGRQRLIEDFYGPASRSKSKLTGMSRQKATRTTRNMRPILGEILKNKSQSFAGIGRYSVNDLLHTLCIYPMTPSFVICSDNDRFLKFRDGIFKYFQSFVDIDFLTRASSVPNTGNPFTFNEWANSEYISKSILVFKRTKAIVPAHLYNDYITQGLLDDEHTIGDPYDARYVQLLDETTRKWQYVPVYRCKPASGKPFYTIIKAKMPSEWGIDAERVRMVQDIKKFTYNTTIGSSQFRVQVVNRPYYHNLEPGTLAIGRPKIMRTGKRGRPCKGMTKLKLKKLYDVQVGRSM